MHPHQTLSVSLGRVFRQIIPEVDKIAKKFRKISRSRQILKAPTHARRYGKGFSGQTWASQKERELLAAKNGGESFSAVNSPPTNLTHDLGGWQYISPVRSGSNGAVRRKT